MSYACSRQLARSALPLLALAALLTLRGPILLAVALNNLASVHLAVEWKSVSGMGQSPRCALLLPEPRAFHFASSALRFAPNERAGLNLGRALWLMGRCTEAAEAWQQVARANSGDETVPVLLASAGYASGDPTAFARILGPKRAAQYTSDNAIRAMVVGNEADLTLWSELAFESDPTLQTAEHLASLYSRQGRTEAAKETWRHLAVVLPESEPDRWWALGQAAYLGQDWAGAATSYARGAPIASNPYDFWLLAGYAALNYKNWPEAEHDFVQAASAKPKVYTPAMGMGLSKYLQNDWVAALTWFDRAGQLAPNSADPPYWAGLTYWQQKNYPQARRSFDLALQLNPQHVASRYYLARCDHELGDLSGAIDGLRQALDLARMPPATSKPWDWALLLGDWQLQSGDKPAALASYRLALEWHPNDPTILKRIESAR